MLKLSEVLPRLKKVDWRRLGARHVVLFGSLASRGAGDDIDLLILPEKDVDTLTLVSDAICEVSEETGVSYDRIDVVILDADTPCGVVEDAWLNGIIVYTLDRNELLWILAKRHLICLDYELMDKRLGLTERALEALKRGVVSS